MLKKGMKKVTAIMLATSLAFSPLQHSSFAVLGDCTANSAVCNRFNYIKNVFATVSEDWGPLKKAWHWMFPTEPQKVLSVLSAMHAEEQMYGPLYEEVAVTNAVKKAMASGNGLLSMLGKACSYIFNPYVVSGFLFTTIYTFANNWYKSYLARKEAGTVEVPLDPAVTMKLLDMYLAKVKGQKVAKEKIRLVMLNIVDKYLRYAAGSKRKTAGPGATVIYMIGPSGVGKTMFADICRVSLSGDNASPLIIEASDIDPNSKMSAVEQLFGMRSKRTQNGGVTFEYSPIIQRLKAVPNTVVIINEYDKMWSPELDEKFRTIVDQGYINVNGEKIDCSAATFIITSNESHDSVAKSNSEIAYQDDGTGSRTFISHDKSFLNRVIVIELDNLKAEHYKEIAERPAAELFARYQHQYGVDLQYGNSLNDLAKRVEKENKGARPIFTYFDSLNSKLLSTVVINNLNGERKRIGVSFNVETGEFELEDLDKKVMLTSPTNSASDNDQARDNAEPPELSKKASLVSLIPNVGESPQARDDVEPTELSKKASLVSPIPNAGESPQTRDNAEQTELSKKATLTSTNNNAGESPQARDNAEPTKLSEKASFDSDGNKATETLSSDDNGSVKTTLDGTENSNRNILKGLNNDEPLIDPRKLSENAQLTSETAIAASAA